MPEIETLSMGEALERYGAPLSETPLSADPTDEVKMERSGEIQKLICEIKNVMKATEIRVLKDDAIEVKEEKLMR